jgi:serine/threonine protein kinase/WD40 repeat protein/tetratricopeptide (TPR) repeat protein
MIDNDASAADPLGQIADEFVEAFRQGKRPSVEEFARRYPEQADEIREMLPALVLMERAKSDGDDSGQPPQAKASAATIPLQQLGDYQILREVGRGGMGVVYEAQQLSLGRHVAIKVLPSHALLDPRHLRRFQREARSAARLHHTNIVPVFGVGEQDGLHYYVMQFIQGLGLDVVLDELRRLRQPHGKRTPTLGDTPGRPTYGMRGLSAAAVATSLLSGEVRRPEPAGAVTSATEKDEGGGMKDAKKQPTVSPSSFIPYPSSVSSGTIHLPGQSEGSTLTESGSQYWQSVARIGMQVADALAHAAGQGVLHRDIKPSNLLVDETGNVWVTDFGLAKADSDGDNLTHTGDIVGTFRYMAPERFNGQGDLRSDVYSLGLTLYELLALRPAFDEADRNKLVKEVMHGEPVRPRKVNRSVPRDLETVVLKAIARDPAHRYQSPAEMAEDLKRFVEDRPVRARRVSEAEKFWRWCRRNPLPASLLAGIVLVFLVGFVGVSWQWREAVTAREDEKNERSRAQALQQGAETARDEAETARDEAKQARNAAARQAAGLLLDRGIEDARGGEPHRALHLFVQALRALPPGDPEAARLERTIRMNLAAWAETVPALEHIFSGRRFDHIAYSPDGERIAMTVVQDQVQCFRTDTGRPVGPPAKIPIGFGAALEFAADGRSLWVASPGYEKVVDLWTVHRLDPVSSRPIQPPIPSVGPVHRLMATADGRYLVGAVLELHPEDRGPRTDASGTRKWRTASIMVWETASGRVVRKVEVNAESAYSTALEASDIYLGLAADGKSVAAWVQRGSNRFEAMTFSVDGNEPPLRQGLPSLGPKASRIRQLQRNLRTAIVIKDGQLHRWSASKPDTLGSGVPAPFRSMHENPSADGRSVVSSEGRVFDTGAWPPRPTGVRFEHPGWQREGNAYLEQSPDGQFATTWLPGEVSGSRLWRLPRPHSRPAASDRQPESADYIPDALFDPRGTSAVLWSYRLRHWIQGINEIHNVRIVDVTTGAVRRTNLRHAELIREVVFAPDGRHFATASFDGTARVWETDTGRPAGPPLPHSNYVATVAFSPDGNTLAAGDYGPAGLIKLWDWRTGKEVGPPFRHDDIILSVSFSPDGQYLVAVKALDWSKNPELLIWEVASGTAVVRMRHQGPSFLLRESVCFPSDNRAMATRDVNGVLHLWELPSRVPAGSPDPAGSGQETRPERGESVRAAKVLGERPLDGNGVTRFSPDGRMVAATTSQGVRLLDGNTLAPLAAGYLPHPDPIKDLAFSPDGTLLLTAHETGSAQLWDLATRKPIGPPAVLLGPILAVIFTPDGKTCLGVALDGTVRRWPVPAPFAESNLTRLADRAVLMTGQRMDDNQGLESVPAEEWRALRTKLVGDGSTALLAPRPDADWHDTSAADAEQDKDADGAEWHLNRLAALRPSDWTIPARRGRVLTAVGRVDEASAAYDTAARLVRSPHDLADWLRAAATDDEAARRFEQGLWNLDRAVKLTPEDWTLYASRALLAHQAGKPERVQADFDEVIRRGADDVGTIIRLAETAGGSGDWKRTAALFTTLAPIPNVPTQARYYQALASLKAGDPGGYRTACDGITAQMPPVGPQLGGGPAYDAAMVFASGPDATADWTKPLAWIDHCLARLRTYEQAHPDRKDGLRREWHLFHGTRGALLFRAGRYQEAVQAIGEALPYANGGVFQNWLFLALAEHRLGHADAAKKAAAKARAVLAGPKPSSVWERAELDLLTAELDAALPVGK